MSKLKLVLLLISCISCSYIENVRLLTGGSIDRENYVQTIPFELRKDLIVIKAQLNADTVLREFIFDTGAFNSKVESTLADALDLKVFTEKTNSTAQGISQKIEVVRIDSLKLGETTIYDLGAGKLNYATTSASPCIAAHGIIGGNLIKLAHWKIDYQKRLLYFSGKPFNVPEGSLTLPFSRPVLSGTPEISLQVENQEIEDIMFDVGYNGGLILPLEAARHFEYSPSEVILDKSTSGIYGTNADSLLVKNLKVNIGETTASIPVEFSTLGKALLGNAFLKHFQVLIDYDKKEIYLHQQEEVKISKPRNFSVAIQNDSLWVVSRTTPELPLALGQTLFLVNGQRPEDVFTSHCDYIMNVNKLLSQDSMSLHTMDSSIIKIHIH